MYNLNKYIANILKTYVKHENNNAKNSTTFSNYIRNVLIEDDEIMVSFDVTSLYTNIPIIDTLNIIKDYVHSDDQFARKTQRNLHKENARIKQVLKENGYQESIISKIFKRITNNHSLPQLQQQTQATDIQEEEIKMSINLPYVEGISEKLRRILRSHKIRSTFYTENTLRKLLCKPKDQVATEDKSNIVYEIDFSNCEAVYFGESKRSLKSRSDEHKRSVRNCDCDKNEIAKHCWEADHNFNWDQKKVVDRESRLIPRKIKETIHSLKNPNHINKISYMLPEI